MKKSLLTLAIAASVAVPASASTAISGGIWFNHAHYESSEVNDSTLGETNYESLILYIDHQQEDSAWQLSSEWRAGKGSFSDPDNNNSGDFSGFHKLWVGYNFSKDRQLVIGKTSVPFGFGTTNFWPGDMGLGGFGDQMDVGVKFSDKQDAISYDLAWFVSDDFGGTSTDTQDDNGHWGSSATYRKVNTAVANISYDLSASQTVGVSYQQGELQDLTSTLDTDTTFGGHNAMDLWYTGTFGNIGVKAQVMSTQRDDVNEVISTQSDEIKTIRQSLTVSYAAGPFSYYIDYTGVATDTDGNDASDLVAFAPGVSYNYGPGWIYAEYITQNKDVNSNGDIGSRSDFAATYLTIDYYF